MAIAAKWSDLRFDREQAIGTLNRRLPPLVALVLVAATAWQLARLFWLVVPAPAAGDAVAPPAGLSYADSESPGGPDLQAITGAHLFGVPAEENPASPPPPEERHEDLAETRLSLALKGTIAVDDPQRSMAIIAATGGDERTFAIGDAVETGTRLHAVYTDRVVLNRGGTLEALRLPQDFPEQSAPAPRPQPARTRTAVETPSIQQVVSQNVTQLADVIRPTPYFVGGQQQGFRVYPGRDRRKFAALGLRPGDLIKDIDGAALTDPQQAMEIFQNLGSASEVTVTVERNGQPEVIVLSTGQLMGDDTR